MNTLQVILLIVGLLLIFIANSVTRLFIRDSSPDYLGKERRTKPVFKISTIDIIYGIAMILGIVGKELFDNVTEQGTIGIRPARLITAIIVSPIVYAAVYSVFTKDEVTLPGLAVAFQNGFFWQTVFSTAQSENSPAPTPAPTSFVGINF